MIAAIVLAAGASSRMGTAKAALSIEPGGRTFEEAVRESLAAAGISTVCVVVAPGREHTGPDHVVNPDPSRGMLSSVQCGLRAIAGSADAILVWPVDHPLVKPETVRAIVAAFEKADPPVVVPTFGARRGHPVLFGRRVIPELAAADPSVGAREVVHAHADRLELPVADPGVIEDIDTPEDYRRAFGGRGVA